MCTLIWWRRGGYRPPPLPPSLGGIRQLRIRNPLEMELSLRVVAPFCRLWERARPMVQSPGEVDNCFSWWRLGNDFRITGPFFKGIYQTPMDSLTKGQLWCFPCWYPAQTVELPLIWDTVAFMWHHYNYSNNHWNSVKPPTPSQWGTRLLCAYLISSPAMWTICLELKSVIL